MADGDWQPVLDGDVAAAAWAAIRAIGDELAEAAPGAAEDHAAAPLPHPGLSTGSAGIAVFLRYLAAALPGQGYDEAATRYLDAAIEAVSTWPLPVGLYSGVTGVAWALRHLDGGSEDAGGTEELDEVLLAVLRHSQGPTEYDLISGIVGFGVYGAEALPGAVGQRCLKRVVERLDELHEDARDGVTWFTPPERVPESQLELAPAGYYNLGVAHGVPGVVVVLAACCRAGVAAARSRRLLGGAVDWLLAQSQNPQLGSRFPSWIGEGIPPSRSRLAWCYGDPGIGAAILTAGGAVGDAQWEAEGIDVLHGAARRPSSTAGVRDTSLCHGSAGLAHLFNRAYQATGDEELRSAANHWFQQTLEMRRPGEGVAGFLAWEPVGDDGLELKGVSGLLTGASGVGLALLAGVTAVEPAWDRLFALSVADGPLAAASREALRGETDHQTLTAGTVR